MPVLLAAGRYDGIAPLANMQAMHEQIPGSDLVDFRRRAYVSDSGQVGVPRYH